MHQVFALAYSSHQVYRRVYYCHQIGFAAIHHSADCYCGRSLTRQVVRMSHHLCLFLGKT